MICTFQCTYCRKRIVTLYTGLGPTCRGNFQPRPIGRPGALDRHRPPTRRVTRG